MAKITLTGNARIDNATAEIALALLDADPGRDHQSLYNRAMWLRDEIMTGMREADHAAELFRAEQGVHPAPGQQVRCKGCGHTWTLPPHAPVTGNEICSVCFIREGRTRFAEPV